MSRYFLLLLDINNRNSISAIAVRFYKIFTHKVLKHGHARGSVILFLAIFLLFIIVNYKYAPFNTMSPIQDIKDIKIYNGKIQ